MTFRFNLPIEVERPDGDLGGATPVYVQIVYQAGRWRAQSQQPPVSTVLCDTLDQALVAVVKEVMQDWRDAALV